jgi:hypothetical protein
MLLALKEDKVNTPPGEVEVNNESSFDNLMAYTGYAFR